MTSVLIDTHVLAWSLIAPALLPSEARGLLLSGAMVYAPPCSLHEITLKIRNGKWDAMAPYADRLDSLCMSQGFHIAPFTAKMAMRSGSMAWAHRDPFDRMIAATAIEMACPLISTDAVFDDLAGLPEWKGRVWGSSSNAPEPGS
ncbi:type II toxin-antitoxin system VapC family toxin [Rhodobacter sp. NSM]|uniref:type II toxin-antitoxin system VapC family toxin n=1 Tax=Rhodobacter sp. NSM TaxID=3457501 RepID=UPI003FD25933